MSKYDCDKKEEKLKQLKKLKKIDITEWAEDDELLKKRFEEKIYYFYFNITMWRQLLISF